jgi:hypothetical protein
MVCHADDFFRFGPPFAPCLIDGILEANCSKTTKNEKLLKNLKLAREFSPDSRGPAISKFSISAQMLSKPFSGRPLWNGSYQD